MNKQSRLVEWFQNLNTWIKRFMALVVGIVGFIILFRENFHLVIVVIVTFIWISLLVLFIFIIFRTLDRREKRLVIHDKKKIKWGRYLAILGIIIEIAIIFILLSFKSSRSFISIAVIGTPTQTSTPTHTLTQIPTNTLSPTITPTVTPTDITNPVEIQFPWFKIDDWPGNGHIDDILSAKEAVIREPVRSAWGLGDTFYKYIDNATIKNVSLLGSATLSFDVENVAESYQANIHKIAFKVDKEPVDPIEDIWMYPPELGGGHPRGFQVTLNYSESPGASRTQTFIAVPGESEDFDFISLAPGERESIVVTMNIPSPGIYQITPIVEISYRNHVFAHPLDIINLMVPRKYRYWGYHNGELIPSPIILDRETGDLLLQTKFVNTSDIPILFESSMINGITRLFFIAEENSVNSLGEIGMPFYLSEARWSEHGDQIIYQSSGVSYAFDLLTNNISEIGPDFFDNDYKLRSDIKSIIETRYGEKIASVTESPNGDLLVIVIKHIDENIENLTNSGRIIIVDTIDRNFIGVQGTSNWCDDPSWSPNGQFIAFVCRHDKNNDGSISDNSRYYFTADETDLLVANSNGVTTKINTDRGIFFDPFWSQDGESILVGGDGIRVFESKHPNIPTTIFEAQLGYCYRPQWKP